MNLRTVVFMLACLMISLPTLGAVAYVDATAPGPVHDGTTWAKAYTTITQALIAPSAPAEIWVRMGLYRERLVISRDVSIFGGFLGYETSASQRIPLAFPTVLDAEFLGRAIDITNLRNVVLDGLVIRRGKADFGGGIRCNTNSIVNVRNCRIENCEATAWGGGIYYGYYTEGSVTDSILAANRAGAGGAAFIEYHSSGGLINCLIIRNRASNGGAIYCPFHSGARIDNCTIAFNSATMQGGAAWTRYGGNPSFTDCIIAFNSAPETGGTYGGYPDEQPSTTIAHCDFWQNEGGNFGGNIGGPTPGTGTLYVDPMFLMPECDEFHLRVNSPCSGMGAYPLESVYRLASIGVAKLLQDGDLVRLTGKVVGCSDGGTVYLEELDRSSAIAVQNLSVYGRGDILASVTGTISTNALGKKVLVASGASLHRSSYLFIPPVGVRLSWLESTTGIYVRTWGKVENLAPGSFALRDGWQTVQVRYSGGGTFAEGDFVLVTGVWSIAGDFLAVDILRPN